LRSTADLRFVGDHDVSFGEATVTSDCVNSDDERRLFRGNRNKPGPAVRDQLTPSQDLASSTLSKYRTVAPRFSATSSVKRSTAELFRCVNAIAMRESGSLADSSTPMS